MIMLKSLIQMRRAYRALTPVKIPREEIENVAELVALAPSCNNSQPWRFLFVQDETKLQEVVNSLNRGNTWAKNASLIIAVFSKPDLDCQISSGRYSEGHFQKSDNLLRGINFLYETGQNRHCSVQTKLIA